MAKKKMIKLFIVDDHKIIINGVRAMLADQEDIVIVGEAERGEEMFQKLEQLEKKKSLPDVLLMDIRLPDANGIELTKKLSEQYPSIGVIALTMHDEDEYISNMLAAGAKSYILKNTFKEELQASIRKVAEGKPFLSEYVTEHIVSRFQDNVSSLNPNVTRENIHLTDKELVILQLIASELTNQEIAKRLEISPRTVHTHRRTLMQKLGVKNTAGLIRTAMELKLITQTPPEVIIEQAKETMKEDEERKRRRRRTKKETQTEE